MQESSEDLAAVQALLDSSYSRAGAHLLSIHTPERRMTAEQVADRLAGMRLLALATSTADGRPIVGPVDGVFYRGVFYFGTDPDSVRARHLQARDRVSATHLPGEELAITVHGRATPVDLRASDGAGFRRALLEVYAPRYGPEFEEFIDSGPVYYRIEAERMFAFMTTAAPAFARPLFECDVDPDPFRQFDAWFEEAAASGIRVPEAAAVATASGDGAPSVRMVLVKEVGERGFVFYSNYESRKGDELATNPRAALLFHWDGLGRQVRVEGDVDRLAPGESDAYVRSRPRGSQLSALASPQSRVVEGREQLERRVAELAARYEGSELPLPDTWGGFLITPRSFEFWQHREDRLHDRLLYTRAGRGADGGGGGGGWRLERLAP